LCKKTGLAKEELLDWHNSFLVSAILKSNWPSKTTCYFYCLHLLQAESPTGMLDRDQFLKLHQELYPKGSADKYCKVNSYEKKIIFCCCFHYLQCFSLIFAICFNASKIAFNAFDADRNGYIDFNEFLMLYSFTTNPNPKDDLNFVFSLLDTNRNSKIERKEIEDLVCAFQELRGERSNEKEASEVATSMLNKFAQEGHDYIYLEDFFKNCMSDPYLLKLLHVA
jgi:hypothetical protein